MPRVTPVSPKPNGSPLFALGQVVATPGALELMRLAETSPLLLIAKHVAGDWGECDPDDAETNNLAVLNGFRVMSVYRLPLISPGVAKPDTALPVPGVEDDRIWCITEADRSVTTFLLPEEY